MAKPTPTDPWDDFVGWCRQQGLQAVPANPWTLAAYIRSCERSMRPTAIQKQIRAISERLFEKTRKRPDRHPTVKRIIERIKESTVRKPKKTPPELFSGDDFVSEKVPGRSSRAKPDAAKPIKPGKKSLRATPKLVRKRRV